MHRQAFIKVLKKYEKEASSPEKELILELINHVLKNKDCFYRKKINGAKDIAASVLLLTQDLQKALFLWHKKIQKWTQPGGHADGETNIHEVAIKELEEETGITKAVFVKEAPIYICRFDYPAHVYGYKKSIYNLFFAATIPCDQKPKIMEPTKCEKMEWFTQAQMLSIIKSDPHEGVKELIKHWNCLMKHDKK